MERDYGHIINVGSKVGLMPGGPYGDVLCTKLMSYLSTNALAEELKLLGVPRPGSARALPRAGKYSEPRRRTQNEPRLAVPSCHGRR